MITLLILIPLIGVLLLLPLNENSNNFLNSIKLPTISLNSNTNSNLELIKIWYLLSTKPKTSILNKD